MHDGAVWRRGSARGIDIAVNHPLCADSAAGFGFTFVPTANGTFHGRPLLDSVLVIMHRPVARCRHREVGTFRW